MSALHPLTQQIAIPVPAQGAAASQDLPAIIAPFDGVVTGVSYVPVATITGANTNTRKHSLINKGAAGAGAVEMAALQYNLGVNATAFDEKAITLDATAANKAFVTGDVLNFRSAAVLTGIADPGGVAFVTISRS
jgi:hypothetical protein